MDKKPSTISITPFDRTPPDRKPNNNTNKQGFTGSIAYCQLMLEKSGAVFEFLLPLKATPVLLGRATPQADPPVNIDVTRFNGLESGVSRTHARFERSEGQIFVRDLNSTNGTWVNGTRLIAMTAHEIYHGDKIEFGRLLTTFYIKT